MNGIFKTVLIIHILFGSVALFVAPAAMMTGKGGDWHRRWGKVFFWAITAVAVTAVVLSVIRSGLFFLLIAVFSFYLALTGYRILYRKTAQQRAGKVDWAAASTMIVGSLALIAQGVLAMMSSSAGVVPLVFGVIGLWLAASDVREFLHHPADKMAWWYSHMTRMMAAYIATVTAFSVVNMKFLPQVTRWLWPTVIGTAAIVIWTRYYRRKFNARRTTKAVAVAGG
jgi:hypothetical protein